MHKNTRKSGAKRRKQKRIGNMIQEQKHVEFDFRLMIQFFKISQHLSDREDLIMDESFKTMAADPPVPVEENTFLG